MTNKLLTKTLIKRWFITSPKGFIFTEQSHSFTMYKRVPRNKCFVSSRAVHRFSEPICFNAQIWNRQFQTSKRNCALPPTVWMIIRRVLNVVAVFTGRSLRAWWARLPNNKRKYFLEKFQERKGTILLASALVGGFSFSYYLLHLIEDPITKRKKFIMFSDKQMLKLSYIELESQLKTYEGKVMTSGNYYRRVQQIIKSIVDANKSVPGTRRKWKIFVINEKDFLNAFVLPSGHIFVFSGLIAFVKNDDQLAAVLGHEMAHALLSHGAEQASKAHLLELILLLPLVAIWAMLPDSIAMSSQYLVNYVLQVLFHLPFSRKLETEADIVGLELISRACFDPLQTSEFWKTMERMEKEEQVEWLATHPNNKTRYITINKHMPKAKQIFSKHCSRPDMNPRS